MTARIAVLYEDKLATSKPKNFGPHVLVLACVADRTKAERELLSQQVDGIPRKGIGNVLADCRMPFLKDRYARVIAVCDDDRVRDHLGLPATACTTQVRSAIGLGPPLYPILLRHNLETVVEAATSVLARPPLTGKPSPIERDRILLNLAYYGTPEKRLKLLELVPSLNYLVSKLVRMVEELG